MACDDKSARSVARERWCECPLRLELFAGPLGGKAVDLLDHRLVCRTEQSEHRTRNKGGGGDSGESRLSLAKLFRETMSHHNAFLRSANRFITNIVNLIGLVEIITPDRAVGNQKRMDFAGLPTH